MLEKYPSPSPPPAFEPMWPKLGLGYFKWMRNVSSHFHKSRTGTGCEGTETTWKKQVSSCIHPTEPNSPTGCGVQIGETLPSPRSRGETPDSGPDFPDAETDLELCTGPCLPPGPPLPPGLCLEPPPRTHGSPRGGSVAGRREPPGGVGSPESSFSAVAQSTARLLMSLLPSTSLLFMK